MTLRSLITWFVPAASIAFFVACGGRSFTSEESMEPLPCTGAQCGAGSCLVGSHRYQNGTQGIPSADGCNTCGCDDGVASCTERACGTGGSGNGGSANGGSAQGGSANGCEVDGTQYDNGEAGIAAPDDCNMCSCINGELACTAIGCVSTSCTYGGVFYQDGDSFDASDGCNTCTCVEGEVACTDVACTEPSDCMTNDECGMDSMCQTPAGSCGGAGSCVETSIACDLSYVPVCGCDGQTYGNECAAQAAGVNVSYAGECGYVASCGGAECKDTQFCKYPEGYCGSNAGFAPGQGAPVPADPGTCTDYPDACGELSSPVCGCDGVTYENPCMADAAGVSVSYAGECAASCFDNAGCAMDQYCMFPAGSCGGGVYPPVAAAIAFFAPSGTCQVRAEACTQEYDPVCGCDGVTYGNACSAAAEGMSVAYAGECQAVAQ